MDNGLRTIIDLAGLFVFLCGLTGQLWALARHRAPEAGAPWFAWRPQRAKREWFATDYGYQMYRWASWNTLLGGLIMLVARLL